jgi:hypothetical protein
MDKAIRLNELFNDLGNALTAAEWPVKAAKFGDKVKLYDTKEIYKDLVYAGYDVENQLSDLKDCVNELCLKCGAYHESYLGACDGCRWKAVKEGLR